VSDSASSRPRASAESVLAPLFKNNFNFDISKITFKFGFTGTGAAITITNAATLDLDYWNTPDLKRQPKLPAHEIAHSVQYEHLNLTGGGNFRGIGSLIVWLMRSSSTRREEAMNKLSVLLALVYLPGCEPRTGVRVAREGVGCVVEVGACSWRDRVMNVQHIEVRRYTPGQASANTCALTAQTGDAALERWHYGAKVAGFQMVGCSPLEPGGAYEVSIDILPVGVTGHFTIDGRGDVKMIDGGCP